MMNFSRFFFSGRWILEYTVSLAGGYDPTNPKPTPLKKGILGLTLNYICWWGFSFGELESVDNLFIAITPRSTLT